MRKVNEEKKHASILMVSYETSYDKILEEIKRKGVCSKRYYELVEQLCKYKSSIADLKKKVVQIDYEKTQCKMNYESSIFAAGEAADRHSKRCKNFRDIVKYSAAICFGKIF